MTDEYIKRIKHLLKAQKYDLAEKRLNKYLQFYPGDLSAKILLGICCLLKGDIETAEQIHKEVDQHPAFAPEEMKFWQKFNREIHSLHRCKKLGVEIEKKDSTFHRDFLECNCVYGGAPFTIYCTVCGETQSIRMGWDPESETERLYRLGKMKCEHCKKETTCKKADEDFLRRRELEMLKAEFKKEKTLLKEGNYTEAEKMLQQHLESAPDDLSAKMLFGTCRLLQGDTETAEQIHKEAEEHYSTDAAATPEEKTFWQKYHNWIIFGTGAMLLLAGTAYAVKHTCDFFDSIAKSVIANNESAKYGGPEYNRYEKWNNSQESIFKHQNIEQENN